MGQSGGSPARAVPLGFTPGSRWGWCLSKQLQIFLRDHPWSHWNFKTWESLYFASLISWWQVIWGFSFMTLIEFLTKDNRRVDI